MLFVLDGALFLVLIHRPLLVTATVSTAEPPRTCWGRGAYLTGLATVYTSWLLTALVMAPLFILLVLLGDVYVWPCLATLACLLLPPLYLLDYPRILPSSQKTAVLSNGDHQGKLEHTLFCYTII